VVIAMYIAQLYCPFALEILITMCWSICGQWEMTLSSGAFSHLYNNARPSSRRNLLKLSLEQKLVMNLILVNG
jgi:hypothetical protein